MLLTVLPPVILILYDRVVPLGARLKEPVALVTFNVLTPLIKHVLGLLNAPPLNVGAPNVGVAFPSLFRLTVNVFETYVDLVPREFSVHATIVNLVELE